MYRSPTRKSQTWIIDALLFLGYCQSSVKLRSQKENTYAVTHPNITHYGVPNIHMPTALKSLLLEEMDNKSTANTSTNVSNQETSLPLTLCILLEEDESIQGWITVIGYKGIEGNMRGNSTASDFIEGKGCFW
jgi:hypothetical protein